MNREQLIELNKANMLLKGLSFSNEATLKDNDFREATRQEKRCCLNFYRKMYTDVANTQARILGE